MGRQDIRVDPPAYPLKLDLQYRLVFSSRRAPVPGSGRTITFSSREVVFAADQSIPPNASVQLSICWPMLLDKRIRLQLVIDGHVTAVNESTVTVRIGKYHFRTRGLAVSTSSPQAIAAIAAAAGPVSLVAAHA